MAIMDYIQSTFEKVLRPQRGGSSGRPGKGIGNTVGATQFEDEVRMRFAFALSPYFCHFFRQPRRRK